MSYRLMSQCALFTSHVVGAAAFVAGLAIVPATHATLYWDANSNLGGNGTWDNNISQNWSPTNAAGRARL